MTKTEMDALPAEDAIQHHDRVDEADEPFQRALHELAVRSGTPGQPMPDEAGQ